MSCKPIGVVLLVCWAAGCTGTVAAPAPPPGASVRVLGTVQDGGLPHPACTCPRCEAGRLDPTRKRHVASLGVLLPASKRTVLIDATPDVREQLAELAAAAPWRPAAAGRVERAPVDGVILTHAHVGHYLGLAFFGFEAVHTRGLPVWATPRMSAFLSANGPWDQLVRLGNLELRPVEPGGTIDLGDGVTAALISVPHRDEYSDTVAVLLAGPRATLLYVPDTDAWKSWPRPLTGMLAGVDAALLDATFFSGDELPGRPVSSIGHPWVTETMDLLAPVVKEGRTRVLFTHLNHSNPALDPASPEAKEIARRGFSVAREGEEFPL